MGVEDAMKQNSGKPNDGNNNRSDYFYDAVKNVDNFGKFFSERRAHLLARHRHQISAAQSIDSKRRKGEHVDQTAKETKITDVVVLSDDESDTEDQSTLIDKLISKPSKAFDNDKHSTADKSGAISLTDDSDTDDHQQPVSSRKRLKCRSSTRKHIDELSDANEFDASLDEDTMNESDIVYEGTSSKHCTLEIEDFEKGGPVWIVNWKMTDDLSEIAQKYATKWQCSKQCVRLSTKENDSEIAFDQSPQQLSFVANGITQLLVRQMKQFARPEDNPNLVKIVFQSQNGNVSKWIPKSEPLSNQTSGLISDLGLKGSRVTFHFESSQVNGNATPESLEIENDDIIDIQTF